MRILHCHIGGFLGAENLRGMAHAGLPPAPPLSRDSGAHAVSSCGDWPPPLCPPSFPSRFGFHNNPRRWEAVNWQVMPSLGGGQKNLWMLGCDLSLARFPAPPAPASKLDGLSEGNLVRRVSGGGGSPIHPWQGAGTPTFSPRTAVDCIIMSRWVLSEPQFP